MIVCPSCETTMSEEKYVETYIAPYNNQKLQIFIILSVVDTHPATNGQRSIFRLKGIKKFIYPAYQSDFNLPAKRPRWSVMGNEKVSKIIQIEILSWSEELFNFLNYIK